MNTDVFLNPIPNAIEPLRARMLEHPLYARLQTLENLRVFMEHHVFAVWDFMSLVKTLQQRLTCMNVPWVPQGEPAVRALINQIVLGEESDRSPDGRSSSHFELYLEAMHEAGAATAAMDEFIRLLCDGVEVEAALAAVRAPECVRDFVEGSFQVIREGKIHAVAAAFTYGREDLIPSMFGELVASLNTQFPGRVETLRYYLNRHIQLDGDEHGKLGRQMVASLCGTDPLRWEEAREAAVRALEQRLTLWDGITAAVGVARGSVARSTTPDRHAPTRSQSAVGLEVLDHER